MSDVKVGQLVWANVGSHDEGGWGDFIGPVTKDTYEVNGEQKIHVQAPDGSQRVVGYREPEGDSPNKGDTFWKIK